MGIFGREFPTLNLLMPKGLGSDGRLHSVGAWERQKDTPNPNGIDNFGDSCRLWGVTNAGIRGIQE